MRFLIFLFMILLGPGLAAEDKVAAPNGEPIATATSAASPKPVCPMGSLCSKNPSLSSDWADQMSNLDLMQDEMKNLKITNPRVSVSVIDTGAAKEIANERGRGRVSYNPVTQDNDLVDAWDDKAQHGTAVTETIRRLAPGDVNIFYTGQKSAKDGLKKGELDRAVEQACDKSKDKNKDSVKIVNVSWNSEDQGHTFVDSQSLYKRMMAQGCVVFIAAGNSGGVNKDHFTSTEAIDRSGKKALLPNGKMATEGNLLAPGDRIPVQLTAHPADLNQCNNQTYEISGSSLAAPETTAVGKNVAEVLSRTEEFRHLEPAKQAELIEQIVKMSAVNRRLDGYRAVKLAEQASENVSAALSDLRGTARFAWQRIPQNVRIHNAANDSCYEQSDCGKRMTCYSDKRRYLAAVGPSSREGQKAIQDLFVTAQNSGDYELAQNWASQLKGVSKSEMDRLVDWNEFRKRTGSAADASLVVDYLTSVLPFMSVPADIQKRFLNVK